MVGHDPVADAAWGGVSAFDPEAMTADGYLFIPDGPDVPALPLLGSAKAKVLSGATVVIEWISTLTEEGEGATTDTVFTIINSAGNEAVEVIANVVTNNIYIGSWFNGAVADISSELNVGTYARNRVAFTITSTDMAISLNGSLADSGIPTEDDYPTEGFDAALVALSGNAVLVSLTIYDPVVTAELAALSALS